MLDTHLNINVKLSTKQLELSSGGKSSQGANFEERIIHSELWVSVALFHELFQFICSSNFAYRSDHQDNPPKLCP